MQSKDRYNVRSLIEKYGRKANMMKWKEQRRLPQARCTRPARTLRLDMSRSAEGVIERRIRLATETAMRYVHSLDPECPVVAEFMETLFGDPTRAMGAPVEDITEEFERRHRKQCKRCQEYAVRAE
jgi:hypothetical protein